jgi:hypothetical protein
MSVGTLVHPLELSVFSRYHTLSIRKTRHVYTRYIVMALSEFVCVYCRLPIPIPINLAARKVYKYYDIFPSFSKNVPTSWFLYKLHKSLNSPPGPARFNLQKHQDIKKRQDVANLLPKTVIHLHWFVNRANHVMSLALSCVELRWLRYHVYHIYHSRLLACKYSIDDYRNFLPMAIEIETPLHLILISPVITEGRHGGNPGG